MSRRFIRDEAGSPAAEFALSLPMLMILMFGALEAGHFFWTEHKVVKAVRDGARYAARLDMDQLCNGPTAQFGGGVEADIQAVTATGLPASAAATPKVPGWDSDQVEVTVACEGFVTTGIYTELGAAGAIVTVSSGPVAYPSLFEVLGAIDTTINLGAESSAAVTGI